MISSHRIPLIAPIPPILFAVTKSFFLGSSRSSDNITASNKKSTSKKEPNSVSEITI